MHEEESTPESEVEAPNGATEQPCAESESEESSAMSPEESLQAGCRKPLKRRAFGRRFPELPTPQFGKREAGHRVWSNGCHSTVAWCAGSS